MAVDGRAWTTKRAVEDLQAYYDYYLQRDASNGSRDGGLEDSDSAEQFVQIARKSIYDRTVVLCQGGVDAEVDRIGYQPPQPGDHLVASAAAGALSSFGHC